MLYVSTLFDDPTVATNLALIEAHPFGMPIQAAPTRRAPAMMTGGSRRQSPTGVADDLADAIQAGSRKTLYSSFRIAVSAPTETTRHIICLGT